VEQGGIRPIPIEALSLPSLKTKVTEVATALGIIGDYATADDAIACQGLPGIGNLSEEDWADIVAAYRDGELTKEFECAFGNGRHFLEAELDGAKPKSVEWRGPRKALYHHDIPADLRINSVYLVSCKYNSKVLLNPSPRALFDGALAERVRGEHWYRTVAPTEYRAFYDDYVAAANAQSAPPPVERLLWQEDGVAESAARYVRMYPADPVELTREQRNLLRKAFARKLPSSLEAPYRRMARVVAAESARRWTAAAKGRERDLLLKMLRVSAVDYFFLGTQGGRPQRLKLINSADWHAQYVIESFSASPCDEALQPQVNWCAEICARADAQRRYRVEGHVEVRWSHGKFCGNPEAKVYLDTPVEQVPGYEEF